MADHAHIADLELMLPAAGWAMLATLQAERPASLMRLALTGSRDSVVVPKMALEHLSALKDIGMTTTSP